MHMFSSKSYCCRVSSVVTEEMCVKINEKTCKRKAWVKFGMIISPVVECWCPICICIMFLPIPLQTVCICLRSVFGLCVFLLSSLSKKNAMPEKVYFMSVRLMVRIIVNTHFTMKRHYSVLLGSNRENCFSRGFFKAQEIAWTKLAWTLFVPSLFKRSSDGEEDRAAPCVTHISSWDND